ncbi:MAG: gliding motility-associated C-terminal domain-containing protein [Winogradskyella sp.]|uniref:T9SS type B sorting domain-containing protein n=1 Tax=Winogradskyella sp. TaxID=1883156 RepID=UPI000F3E97B3|nr:T9SS type B sorting domain-containing protein [Winogradskyella sp.]RNC88000.1 MAG: gliding motility-associated C-terminal domain-containing protein [Winogradskyella sp.]
MLRYNIALFLILLTGISFGQVILTQTHNDATIGIDRKAWNGLGNITQHSDGYAHDFTLPSSANPCEEISSISIEINFTGYSNNNVCPHYLTYFNMFYGCTTYVGGATCLPATNLIAEPNYPVNVNPPTFNYGNPLGSPLNSGIQPDFGDNLSIDIIPVSDPGCNPVSNGHISHQYTITVTVTITDTTPVAPTGLECWETATLNTMSCMWEVTGTQPTAPTGLECWETATFNDVSCMWEVTGTQPTAPTGLECWETATFNTMSCMWEVTGTQPLAPTGLECWETATFNTVSCMWEVTGTQPLAPTGLECWETATFNTVSCMWEVTGTQPTAPTGLECWETATFNDVSCMWEVTGTQPLAPTGLECWETATFNTVSCMWEVTGTQPIQTTEEFVSLCEGDDLPLVANSSISNPQYLWDSGEMTQSISVDTSGIYQVEVTDGCLTDIIIFNVSAIEVPVIDSIVSNQSSITVNVSGSGIYQYSLDGINYQSSNIFSNVTTGLYTIYVRFDDCNFSVTQEYFHLYIQKFITPNGDGRNDFFSLNLDTHFSSTEVYIFDRYGKLLYSAVNTDANWDGTYNGQNLPTSDYWYYIVLDNQKFTGHFTLKR